MNTDFEKWINFGSGPAALPQEVLQEASEAIINYRNTGLSILEIPHRGKLFNEILEEANALVKRLCALDDAFEVLWLQGGGRMQFSMIPMNFLRREKTAAFIESGHWSEEACQYARYYGNTEVIASSKKDRFRSLPDLPDTFPADLAYLHLTTNNTIFGTQWPELPEMQVPLVADMSSDIFSRKRRYSSCSLFYAVAQKNLGPAGVTLVAVRKDFLQKARIDLPPFLSFIQQVSMNSLVNTPPVFAIFASLLMLRWTSRRGIDQLEQESILKSDLLYSELERNTLFKPYVSEQSHRSRMNICFNAVKDGIEEGFLDFCERNRVTGIRGHRSTGGFRASLYNAITVQDVRKLISLMQEYEHNNIETR